MNKHTPGPWLVSATDTLNGVPAEFEITGNGGTVALINTCENQGLADARLIAAAPEMLETLQILVDYVTSDGAIGNAEAPIMKARALINRITGEQP